MAEDLNPEHFTPHVGKVFRVEGTRHALTLARVEQPDPDTRSEAGYRQPFTLIFRGPPGDVLPEGMHHLATGEGVAFTLYVIPTHTPARDRQDYQAAFN